MRVQWLPGVEPPDWSSRICDVIENAIPALRTVVYSDWLEKCYCLLPTFVTFVSSSVGNKLRYPVSCFPPVSYPRSKLIPEVSGQLLRMLIGSDSSLKPVSSIAWSVIMA